ncbi:MAG: NADP oxidoreductase [Desulfoprunum sp.]|jgi:NAD-reducing hydrogenase small subunit|uniref:NADH-quinone oxidoreductase subunit B family protein n=1 Tax=Desulfoprunum sp. TaxID=2020866 RepID=UPI00052B9CC7|nr:hypothetical protein JT06_12565 [Desulfobulbus sp. Tol-SR]
MNRLRLATTWLDGCSGCHMSLLDLDEALLDILAGVEMVYGPLVDVKDFPARADVTLVEGAVGSEADRRHILEIRERTGILVSFGDCAVTANVPAMRNRFPVEAVIARAYVDNADRHPAAGDGAAAERPAFAFTGVPRLCPTARPVHEFVPVDVFVPGCPPAAAVIAWLLTELVAGRTPEIGGRSRFGA